MDEIELTDADRASPLWDKLMRRTKIRIDRAHLDNERTLSPEQTAKVRGRLEELRAFERLNTNEPPFQPVA